jgi:hypothetical protein
LRVKAKIVLTRRGPQTQILSMDRPPAKPKADVSREERLAKALRDNLRRRKGVAPKPPPPEPKGD